MLVAPGVTATLGYTDVDTEDEGAVHNLQTVVHLGTLEQRKLLIMLFY